MTSLALGKIQLLKYEHVEKMAKFTYKFQDSIKDTYDAARKKAEAGR